MRPIGALVLVVSLLLLFSLAFGIRESFPAEPAAVEKAQQTSLSGRAIYAGSERAGYTKPSTTFTLNRDSLARGEQLTLSIQNEDYIYKHYYVLADGKWQKQSFPEKTVGNSNWVKASAIATLSTDQLKEGKNYILAYSCSRAGSNWDCHNNKWQIHEFDLYPLLPVPPADQQCGSDDECPLAYACVNYQCVPKPCQQNAECPVGFFCDTSLCASYPVDKSLTLNAAMRAKSLGYEEEVWQQRENFRNHMLIKLSNSVHWADYSSAQGWSVYHILTDLSSLSWAIDTTSDEARRSAYAALGKEILDITVLILATELGTCSSDSECPYFGEGVGGTGGYRCVNNECVLRYLDEAHGTGGAGLVMNAIYEHKNLRNIYQNDLTNWAQQLKPVLDRNILRTKNNIGEGGYLSCNAPHMSAKIAPAYLVVGKILNDQSYIDAFTNIVEETSACRDKNYQGWPGANKDSGYAETDISHAIIDAIVQHLGYREALRGNVPAKVTEAQLTKFGDAFFLQEQLYYTDMPLGHSVLARFSAQMAARAELSYPFTGGTYVGLDGKTYQFTEDPGTHAYTRKFETLAGFMAGFSTKVSAE